MSSNYMDDEAEREDEENRVPYRDSSEEEDDIDDYEKDDFIVDEEEPLSDDDPDADSERVDRDEISRHRKKDKRKRRKYREDSPELAEGDFELLEEKGLHVNRKKKLRRLRKGASDDEVDDMDDDFRGLADDYDDEAERDRRRDVDENFDYDDDLDDFIDDGGRGRRRRMAERKGLVSSEAVRAARSIFGDAEEMMQYKTTTQYFQDGDQAGGIGGSEDDDDDDYLAEDDDEGTPRPRRRGRRVDETRSTESALRAMAATTLDDDAPERPKIVARYVTPDIPERLIRHFGEKYSTPSQAALRKQAEWIYNYGFRDDPNIGAMRIPPEQVVEKIVVCLQYVHRDKLDIPFIAMYRKDYITPELIWEAGENLRGSGTPWNADPPPPPAPIRGFNSYQYDGIRPGLSIEHLRGVEPGYDDGFGDWSTLWKIMDWDLKFAQFNRRRQRLIEATQAASQKGVPESVIDQVVSSAKLCDNEQQLADCERFLRLSVELAIALQRNVLGEDAEYARDEKRQRRPSRRRVRYADFCKKGYRGLSELYGLSATQFAENVHLGARSGQQAHLHPPVECEDEPLEAARLFARRLREESVLQASTLESDPSRLLAAARLILVKEMTNEILVAQSARMILAKEGTVTVDTNPTSRGITDVDDEHPLRQVTFIAGKKLERFANSVEFSLIKRAVDLGYTKVKINFQEEQVHEFSQILQRAFCAPPNGSILVDKWNAERKLVADQVLEELKIQIRNEIQQDLYEKTTETLKRQMTHAASRRMLLGPCRPYPKEDGAPIVLAICVTREEDEEPDKNQARKDMEDAAERGRGASARRVAHERLTFVVVDENGEYVSSQELFAGWLRRPMKTTPPDAVREQLKSFIKRMKPQVVVVGIGSGGRAAIRLKDDVRFVLHEMLNEGALNYMLPPDQLNLFNAEKTQDTTSEGGTYRFIDPYVVCVDDWPAKIYARCKTATVGLPVDGMTLLEKRAIALARLAQEPLTVYAGICSDRAVAPKFKVHQYHYFLKAPERVLTLQRALIRAVCTNGIDINRVLSLPHTKPLVQYVGGLGEHKANALIRALEAALSEEDKGLPSRKHLWNKDFMGRTVFMSAAAFLRVRDPELHNGGSTSRATELRKRVLERRSRGRRRDDDDADAFYDPLDDSRIHPEHYAVAIKIADEALRDDEGKLGIDLNDENGQLVAIRVTSAVLDKPDGLRRLALDEYAEHLFKLRRGKLYETVKLIAREFHGIYSDYRRPLVAPTPQAMFYMVTGADPMKFRVGSKVTATNCRLAETLGFIMCMLPNNVQGSVDRYEIADEDIQDDDLKKLVTEGSSLACRVVRFEYDKFRAKLTSKPSVLQNPVGIPGYVPIVNVHDDCYRPYPVQASGMGLEGPHAQDARDADLLRKSTGSAADEIRRRKMSRLRIKAKSVVNHRLFRDISGPDAVETLRNALPGDVIIRPSAYSKDSFVFSSKFAALDPLESGMPRDIFHIEFKIEKDPNNSNNPSRLTIGSEVYEHVDEALEQFLHPIIGNLKEGLDHRKFRLGGEEQLKKLVANEKRMKPRTIPYYIGLSEKRDLHMFIAYVPGASTPRTEYIRVVQHGYKLRDVLHQNIEKLCQWFKKNMTKGMAIRRPGSAIREVPASPFATLGTPRSQTVPLSAGATPVFDAPPPRAMPQNSMQQVNAALAQNPFMAAAPVQNGARPVAEAPPPPTQPPGSGGHGRPGEHDPGYNWNRAVPSMDGPPPRNGTGPPGRFPPQRDPYDMRGRPPPPRDHPMHDIRGPPPGMGRGDMRRPPMRRDPPPPMHGRGGPAYRGSPNRGSRQLGPPSPRRGAGGGMPEWRGSKPVPAWKRQLEQQEQQQNGN